MRPQLWWLPGLSLSCLLGASACLSPETNLDALQETAEPTESEEATGEAAQPAYESMFQFVVLVQDDGTGEAGGWQHAKATLKFSDWRHPLSPNSWQCPVTVGMPIRAKLQGRISPEYAAQITAEITTIVSESVMHSRDRWIGEEYCAALRAGMEKMFRGPYQIGATVSRL